MRRFPARAAAGAAALSLAALLTAAPARGELRILAPPDGAVLAAAAVPLIVVGAAPGVEVSLNGRKAPISQTGTAFTGMLNLAEGRNVLTVRSGDVKREMVLVRNPAAKDKDQVYRYHDPVQDGSCRDCHPLGVGRTTAVEARLCRSCHDPKDGAPFVHGPIGAGQCTICHDPHGGSRKAFLVAATLELCVSCHDQSRTREHVARSGKRQCTECHDPHGSKQKYLLY